MRPWAIVAVAVVALTVGAFGMYVVQLGQSIREGKPLPPVVVPAPVVQSPEVTVEVPPTKIDLGVIQREVRRLQGITMETAYGEGCWRAPSPRVRRQCLKLLR